MEFVLIFFYVNLLKSLEIDSAVQSSSKTLIVGALKNSGKFYKLTIINSVVSF